MENRRREKNDEEIEEEESSAGGHGGRASAHKSEFPSEPARKRRKPATSKRKEATSGGAGTKRDGSITSKDASKKARSRSSHANASRSMTPAQQAMAIQVQRIFESHSTSDHDDDDNDLYDASIVASSDNDDDGDQFTFRGHSVRLDRPALQQMARKYILRKQPSLADSNEMTAGSDNEEEQDELDLGGKTRGDENAAVSAGASRKSSKSKSSKDSKAKDESVRVTDTREDDITEQKHQDLDLLGLEDDIDTDRDGSIFGQTMGASNSTWVECDKCKKWRRLRGVIDAKKLPSRWVCSMNKTDPERARCSAPEEEYETTNTPESAADARTRRHLRIWVRRLQGNESYETRQPTQTRGKKRHVSSSKEPYEWVRCCNPACGKWRAILRIMDAKSSVIERTSRGEWYCVMNNWDEKTASCAAPQENLPALGCPPWVMQD